MRRLLACLLVFAPLLAPAAPALKYRWVYVSQNLLVDQSVVTVQGIMKRAKAAGYNGVLLADYKFQILDRMDERYFRNVEKVKQTARELGMDLYPATGAIGYSSGILAHDPNLAEGVPVKNALFVARNGQGNLAPDPPVSLKHGDFEQAQGDRMLGWGFQDGIGQCSFADTAVKHGGSCSLRFDNIGKVDPQNGHGRINQTVAVSPWRQYHLSVWVKTQDFERPGEVRGLILSPGGRALNYQSWGVKSTQDWTECHVVFNSLDNTSVLVYFGVWGAKGGKLWFDDAKLEEIGLMNLIRRDGCPLIVKGEDGTVYQEGRDFEPVKDERSGTVPWAGEFDVYHQPATIKLAQGSRVKDGQRLRVSFYHTVTVYEGQVACCLSEPKVYDVLRDQIERVNKLLSPKGVFLSHDEIRVANWCKACTDRKLTPGQELADNFRRCYDMVRTANPKAEVFAWSDMFDPLHNAHGDYYLVNGTWAGSWEGLPKDVIVANWNMGAKRKESMRFFADRGNKQILAGYYDGPPGAIRDWLKDAEGIPGIVGVIYTTWANNYADLEAFAKAAWGQE